MDVTNHKQHHVWTYVSQSNLQHLFKIKAISAFVICFQKRPCIYLFLLAGIVCFSPPSFLCIMQRNPLQLFHTTSCFLNEFMLPRRLKWIQFQGVIM